MSAAGQPRVTHEDIRTYVINLPRRPDRRNIMEATLPRELKTFYTSDWAQTFDGHELDRSRLQAAGVGLFPWQIESANPWWGRPLKLGEIGCTLAHLACWRHAADDGREPYVLILEDDAVLGRAFLDELTEGLACLARQRHFDLLYLGRYPLEPDRPALAGFVSPGYSHCTYAYLLRRQAIATLLATRLDQAVVPVDEFLPSLYTDHPRPDLRARFPRRLTALAFDPPLVRQRPKQDAGSDTEDSPFADW